MFGPQLGLFNIFSDYYLGLLINHVMPRGVGGHLQWCFVKVKGIEYKGLSQGRKRVTNLSKSSVVIYGWFVC
jgi:hypothetical protein